MRNGDGSTRDTEEWPGVAVPRATLEAWRAARPSADEAFAADHHIACACLARVPGAAEAFTRRYLASVERYLGSLARSPDRVDEVRQRLAVRLLVGEDARGPRLADYAGQGSLEGWVRIAAVRIALQLDRRERPPAPGDAPLADAHDGELSLLRRRYRPHFKRALEAALTALDPAHRLLLRLHYVEGMTTAAMAALQRTSRATLVRRITDARDALRAAVATELGRTLKLTSHEQVELMTAVRSVLDVSVVRLLRRS